MRRVIIDFEAADKGQELTSSVMVMNSVCGILADAGCVVRKAEQHPVQEGAIQIPRMRTEEKHAAKTKGN